MKYSQKIGHGKKMTTLRWALTLLPVYLLVAGSSPLLAQSPRQTYFSVARTEVRGDTVYAGCVGYLARLVQLYQPVTLRMPYSVAKAPGFDNAYGSGTVIYRSDSTFIIQAVLSEEAAARGVQVDDLVNLTLRDTIFDPTYLSGFLIAYNINLLSSARKPLYTQQELASRYLQSPAAADQWLIDTVHADVRDFFEAYDYVLQEPTFTALSGEGRNKGKSYAASLQALSPADVRAYLWYIAGYPLKYIGEELKANESIAGWVVSDAPYSGFELMDIQRSFGGSTPAFLQHIRTLPDAAIDTLLANDYVTSAEVLFYWSHALGMEYLSSAPAVAQALQQPYGAALAYLYLAEKWHNQEDYLTSLRYCAQSEKIYLQLRNYDRLLDIYFKQAYCHYQTAHYDSSLLQLAKARQVVQRQGAQLVDFTPRSARFKYLHYMGNTFFYAGRYQEALLYADSAQALLLPATTPWDQERMGIVSKLKAEVHYYQNLFEPSITFYEAARQYYLQTGMTLAAAELNIDIAISLFKLSRYAESTDKLNNLIAFYRQAGHTTQLARCYSQLGQNFWEMNRYDTAILSHEYAISLRKQSGERSGEAFSWKQLGKLYQKAGYKSKALLALDSAAYLYSAVADGKSLAGVLQEKAAVLAKDKETEAAAALYRRAANVLSAAGNVAGYAEALHQLGMLYFDPAPERAMVYLDSAQALLLQVGNRSDAGYAMLNLGALEKNRGKLQEGKQWYETAHKLLESLNDRHAMAHYYRARGRDEEWQLNMEAANAWYARAIAIYQETDTEQELRTLANVGNNLAVMGRYEETEATFDTLLHKARAAGQLYALAAAFQSKAWMLLSQGKYEAGMALADSAAHYYSATDNLTSLASVYALRGDFFRNLYRFKDAHAWYTAADSAYLQAGNAWGRSVARFSFVVLHYYQGNYRASLDAAKEALRLRPFVLQDQSFVDLQVAMAENYYYLGATDSALAILNMYLPIARSNKLLHPEMWIALMKGRILTDQKKYAEAVPLLRISATEAARKLSVNIYQQATTYLGMAYSGLGRKDSAAKYIAESVGVARSLGLLSFSWEALYAAGLQYYNEGDYAKAIPLLKEAVELVNRQANSLFGGDEAGNLFRRQPAKEDLYKKLLSALTRSGQKEEAWQYANLAQAAAMTDLAGGLSAELNHPEKQEAIREVQQKFEQLRSVENALTESKKDSVLNAGQIAALLQTRAVAESGYLNYIEDIKKRYPELGTYFANQVSPEVFRNLHTYLPEDMAMLMYVVNDSELLIFWATQEQTGIVTVDLPANFTRMVDDWLAALKNPLRPAGAGPLVLRTRIGSVPRSRPVVDVKQGATTLYNWLMAPVMEAIGNKAALCIIPNGKLAHLPFHALGKAATGGKFEYLAARYNVFYTNKPTEMFLPWNRRNKQQMAAFGNPDKSLANAGIEVKAIQQVYNAAQVFTEDMATSDKAKESLGNMHYVHFATHGVLRYPDFDSSYLVFAPGTAGSASGRLTLFDIRSLNIRGCDLVTLSACETALSAEVAKGWYVSPVNAFLTNKVRSVVASLWEVDDKSTSVLMEQFYKHLSTMPKAEALRQAMADVSARPEFEHPFYWAAFVLYGDWQ